MKTYPYALAIGQALLILQEGEENGTGETVVNGYAYPFIEQELLEDTLPFLSEISIFSYGFNTQGYLIFPQISDERILIPAREVGVPAILTLTPFDENGNFNNNYIHILVNNEEVSDRLINELVFVMNQKGYEGLDIDFEFILPEDRVPFAEFVRKMTEAMNTNIPNVRAVLDYAITEIPVEKISIGIPNYGYDWPLPYERGVTAARTIGNMEAIQIAITYNAVIQYDETSKAPYFQYRDENSIEHEVWFEDVRSILAKFELIKEYGFRGCGYWQLMRPFKANWLLLNQQFQIVRGENR